MASVTGASSRLTGMVSGLDTESIVENLLAASKAKLEAAEKQKTTLQWKQEAYKDITKQLSAFQSKYFGTSATSSTSTLFGDSLQKLSTTCDSPYLTVTAGSDSAAGSIYVADIVSLASSAKITGTQSVSADPTIDVDTSNLDELVGKSVIVTLNGVQKAVTFSDKTYTSVQDVRDELISQLSSVFGSGKISVWCQNNKITLSSSNSTLQLSVPSSAENDPSSVLDFGGYSSNRVNMNDTLASAGLQADVLDSSEEPGVSFTINGVDFSFGDSNTINDIMNTVNASKAGVRMTYSSLTDTFSLASTSTGEASSVVAEDTSGSLIQTFFADATYTAGTDAVVRLSTNGSTNEEDLITVTRSTNTLNVDNTTISLTGKAAGDEQEGININLSYDTEAIATKIEDFIEDYNELLSTLTGKLSEERYKDYEPLTDDEKSALSDTEIELWTEKAKSGLLRSDPYLSAIASDLRTSLNSIVQGLGDTDGDVGMLSEIGITTGAYSEKGQLHVDGEKLREALEKDADKVMDLFAQKSEIGYSAYASSEQNEQRFEESGVLWRLSDILSENLSTVGKKGALISLVGSPDSTYNTNTEYAQRIQNMETKISDMEDAMEDEEDRYWAKFTAMETAMQTMQSQSSWLSSMLGGTQ